MEFLIDSNVLCRLVRPDDPQHAEARQAIDILLQQRRSICITPQVEREFWVVATRPRAQKGLGLSADEAMQQLAAFEQIASFRRDIAIVHENWKQLALHHQVLGKKAHDACHVAAMQAHGIRKILTFDAGDFRRYEGLIEILAPAQINGDQTTGTQT